jgi:hypothetical protein
VSAYRKAAVDRRTRNRSVSSLPARRCARLSRQAQLGRDLRAGCGSSARPRPFGSNPHHGSQIQHP